MIYELSFRDESQNVGGPVLGGRLRLLRPGQPPVEGLPALNAFVVEPRLVFVVHGYNVSRDRGRASLQHFVRLLTGHQGVGLVTTLWPGDHWLGAASYPFEGRDADHTAANLARFVGDQVPTGTPVAFVSHSLGARVVLGAMNQLPGRFRVDQACVLAAAVDDTSPADVEVYRPGVAKAQRVSVLSSTRDLVLLGAYPLGDLLQSFLFFWREQAGLALGWHGPRPARGATVPPNVEHEAIPGSRNAGHGDYLPPPAGVPNAEQASTAAWVDAVLSGASHPRY